MRRRRPTLLRHLRRVNELTIHELADKTGINVSTLSLGERRVRPLSEEHLTTLAQYFKVEKDDLLRDAPKVGGMAA